MKSMCRKPMSLSRVVLKFQNRKLMIFLFILVKEFSVIKESIKLKLHWLQGEVHLSLLGNKVRCYKCKLQPLELLLISKLQVTSIFKMLMSKTWMSKISTSITSNQLQLWWNSTPRYHKVRWKLEQSISMIKTWLNQSTQTVVLTIPMEPLIICRRTISIQLENTTIKESRALNPLILEVQSIKLFLKTWRKFMVLGLS